MPPVVETDWERYQTEWNKKDNSKCQYWRLNKSFSETLIAIATEFITKRQTAG